jgi:hypothetical protein
MSFSDYQNRTNGRIAALFARNDIEQAAYVELLKECVTILEGNHLNNQPQEITNELS